MIHSILNAFSDSIKGFWQFWSLEGIVLMTSAIIQDSSLFEELASSLSPKPGTANFVRTSDDRVAPIVNTQAVPISDEAAIAYRDRQITFSEIFTYVLPDSKEASDFEELAKQIWIVSQETSLVNRDDSKVVQAFSLMSGIIDLNWDKFSLKVKVLLLKKLQPFNKNIWQFSLELIFKFPNTLTKRLEKNKRYAAEYSHLEPSEQRRLTQKSIENSQSFFKSIMKTLNIVSKVFKKDGYLLEDNRENISEFAKSVKTINAERQVMNKYSNTLKNLPRSETYNHHILERTPEKTAELLLKLEEFFQEKRDFWENMTEEEQEISNSEFTMLNEYLEKSRG